MLVHYTMATLRMLIKHYVSVNEHVFDLPLQDSFPTNWHLFEKSVTTKVVAVLMCSIEICNVVRSTSGFRNEMFDGIFQALA